MGLPASQERLLDRIEEALKEREPRLASMFAMFTRLNTGERLPRTEALEAVRWWSPRAAPAPGLALRAVLLLSLVIVLAVTAVFLGTSQAPVNCQGPLAAHGVTAQSRHAAAAGSSCNPGRRPKPGQPGG